MPIPVGVNALPRLVAALQHAAADPETRGPLVALLDADDVVDLRIPPRDLVLSPAAFMCALRSGIDAMEAYAAGFVLPVRTLWGEDVVCEYADAEAVILVAAEDVPAGVGSVGIRCALHRLPRGWEEAHDALQWLARPLRHAVAS